MVYSEKVNKTGSMYYSEDLIHQSAYEFTQILKQQNSVISNSRSREMLTLCQRRIQIGKKEGNANATASDNPSPKS